ncbi:MAG TPA: WecB/TagA/CpsF family glycosyltransferase [Dehalococcoidia bacterium]|nr:WecB/TagA/CpsF family glycosyltransferase [Dehalococcoidia bacterium]
MIGDDAKVLGVRFHALTRAQAASEIARLAGEAGPAYVVKPYSEFIPRSQRDARVREVLNGAALCLADGAGILWAAHYLSLRGGSLRALLQFPLSLASLVLRPTALRSPLPEAMHGVDFTWVMLEALAEAGRSAYLLGGTADEVAGTEAAIRERLPALHVTGFRDGYFARGQTPSVVAAVAAANADVLLVAMGFPRQEKFIADNLVALGVRVAVAEGGSFSFISGATPRALPWMRRAGLEWLYRLARQPRRIRRQLALPVFVWLVLRERLRRQTD